MKTIAGQSFNRSLPGFSLFVVLGLLLVLSFLTLFLVQLYRSHELSLLDWHNLDQAILNTESGLNYFASSGDKLPWGVEHGFEFEQDNGFKLLFVPFGIFWLVHVEGYSSVQSVEAVSIVGSRSSEEITLQLNQPMFELVPGKRMELSGSLLLPNRFISSWDPEHDLADVCQFEEFVPINRVGLQERLLAPFQKQWIEDFKLIYPEAQSVVKTGVLDLSKLPVLSAPLIITADTLIVKGVLRPSWPVIIICSKEFKAPEGLHIDHCWVFASGKISVSRGMDGEQIHLCGHSVVVKGEVDAHHSSCTSYYFSDHEKSSHTSLKGRGSFHGTLVSLSEGDPLKCSVYVDPFISTEGFIFSNGEVAVRGRHVGQIRGNFWFYYGDINARGKLDDIFISSERSYPGPWGLRKNGAMTVDRWEVTRAE